MSAARSLEALDRRGYPRYDAWKHGFVEVKSRTRIACLIENVSESGALLRFASATALPKRFRLIVTDDDLTLTCDLVRLDGNAIGVRFVAADAEAIAEPQSSEVIGRAR